MWTVWTSWGLQASGEYDNEADAMAEAAVLVGSYGPVWVHAPDGSDPVEVTS